MHRGESARETAFALYDHAEQEKPAHAQPAREKEIQSVFKAAYVAPRNEIILDGTQDRQTPFRISSREPHHAAPPDRHRHRGNRLQESRSLEKIRHRERQNSPSPRHRHARASASQDHPRNQAQPLRALDEIAVAALCERRIISGAFRATVIDRRYNSTPSSFARPARLAPKIRAFRPTARLPKPVVCYGKENRETCSCAKRDGR
jgi:hypothetical protein